MNIEVHYKGDLYTKINYLPSNYNVITSVNHDDYPCPTDLLVEALGACTVSNIAYTIEKKLDISPFGVSCRLAYEMADKPVHKIKAVEMIITVEGSAELTEKQKALIENAARTCAVKNSLNTDIDFLHTFVYK